MLRAERAKNSGVHFTVRFGRIQDLGFLIIPYTNRIREISVKSPLAYGARRESLRGVLHVNSHNNFAKEPF